MQTGISQAILETQTMNAQDAIQFLRLILKENEKNIAIWALLASRYTEEHQYQLAKDCYTHVLSMDPDYHIARFQLGLLQLCLAEFEAAQQTWSHFAALDDTAPLKMFVNGIECLTRDQFSEARSWLEQGIAHNHDNVALNQDMHAMIERIKTIEVNVQDQNNQTEKFQTTTDMPSQHFLVSGYGKNH